ncbi:MAG: purine-nucleoside phosphorylase [Gemmatimonadetes bacterium]|nr:purine-nucleoside phosphorylase [Gemmatimonadota bacterium]
MTTTHGAADAQRAAEAVCDRLGVRAPVIGIVLGSGLGTLADRLTEATRVPYAEIPGFHAPKVDGHRGELIAGQLGGREVLCLAGRFHMYEGHPARVSAFPIRVLHALGARRLFVSNAAGGVRRSFRAGELMRIVDHLNLTGQNPLTGPVEPGDQRFNDMTEAYSVALGERLDASAQALGVPLASGVYAGLLGPNFETPAEVRMLERLGADAVGMSTVAEVIVARNLGMEVAGISLITNPGAGISSTPLNHEEVMAEGERAAGAFGDLVAHFVSGL